MRPSILTLHDVSFLTVSIENTPAFKGKAKEFSFDEAQLGWDIRHGKHTDGDPVWWVGVTFALKSEPDKISPYQIHVRAAGMFDIDEDVPEGKREMIVYENGAALVYGAIREMVTTVTARCIFGPLVLPTATFVGAYADHLEKKQATETQPLPTE